MAGEAWAVQRGLGELGLPTTRRRHLAQEKHGSFRTITARITHADDGRKIRL
jgi:hypothetical protein